MLSLMGIKDERTDLGADAKTQMKTKIVPSHTCHCSFYLREHQACVSPQEFGKKSNEGNRKQQTDLFNVRQKANLFGFLFVDRTGLK